MRSRRTVLLIAAGCAAVILAVVGVLGAWSGSGGGGILSRPETPPASQNAKLATATPKKTVETLVEVPNVRGKPLNEAEIVLTAAGLVVRTEGATGSPGGSPPVVYRQSPQPGEKLPQGECVSLTVVPGDSPKARRVIVVLDPGHQDKPDMRPEPLGPGSTESKEKATAGAVGAVTGRRECAVALELTMKVKARLEAVGIKVIVTRTSDAVNISNVARADIANRSGADLFVRVHADAASGAKVRGVGVLYAGGNGWTRPIEERSRRAAAAVQAATTKAAGANDRGISARPDLSGFNWSRVPAILVETGFLSNADDDRLLATPEYQDKLAAGMASGIQAYLGR